MGISVMIVDDEHLERILIRKSYDWEGEGFTIVGEAGDGREGLELYKQLEPQLVVTDINMPYMDGLELSRQIKELNDSVEITIISGFNEFRYAQRAINVGVNSFLLKPINPDELSESARKSKKMIESRERLTAQPVPTAPSEPSTPSEESPPAASQMLGKILRYIDANYCDYTLSLKTIAANFYLNDSYLSRMFKHHMGRTLTEYITQKRMEKAKLLLYAPDSKAYEVSEAVGINDPHYFAQCFKRQYGESPTQFRQNTQK